MIAWEQSQGINSDSKKKKKRKETSKEERNKTSSSNPRIPKPTEQHGKERSRRISRKEKEESVNLRNKVREVVWSWVKEGKKWLGF
jgi:hypothetical protein